MTLRHMKIFEAVFRHSNITKAAEELHLAQPSVSVAVRELDGSFPRNWEKNSMDMRFTLCHCSMKWNRKYGTGMRWA